jgi:hypothetical protein
MRIIRNLSFLIMNTAPEDLPDDAVINAVPLPGAVSP